MRLSNFYLKTYKDCALNINNDSLKLLYRGGLIKFLEEGSYTYTPMGNLFFQNTVDMINNKFRDYTNIRINGDVESVLNNYISDMKSYKDIPVNLSVCIKSKNKYYKFKDGLLNPKEENILKFITITSTDNINNTIELIENKLNDIIKDFNIEGSKNIDEKSNLKYFYKSSYPLREIIFCEQCGYANLKEDSISFVEKDLSTEQFMEKEEVYTPNVGSIEGLEKFLNVSSKKLIKTLLFEVDNEIIGVLLRGDRSINLNLLAKTLKVKESSIKMATEDKVRYATNAEVGFAGPIGLKVNKLFADEEIIYIRNGIIGGNKTNYHIKNVNYKIDFKVDKIGNFKEVEENHICIKCENILRSFSGINYLDVNILEKEFKYLNQQGREENLYIVETSFYLDRLFSIIVENNKDEMGIKWPEKCSYFDYHIIIGNIKNEKEFSVGTSIYEDLTDKGYNVLLDDRKERIGFKFKDSELIGIPKLIVVGKDIENDEIEFRNRITSENNKMNLNIFNI